MLKPTVAALGTGIMGAPMARNLLRAGFPVRVWNRTRDKAEPLAADGAVVCDEPAEAAAGAEVVLTMLHDGPAVEQVMAAVLPAMEENAVWLQCTTVGAAAADTLAALARGRAVSCFDAPVLGTRQPAEQGNLTVLISGPATGRDLVQPVCDAVGNRVSWVGMETEATRLKLVLNSWVLALTAATGETVGLAEALGIDPSVFLETISGGPLDSGYAQVKGGMMLARDFPASFKTETAAKDAALIAEAGRAAGAVPLLAEAVRDQMRRAVALGHGEDDMAAVVYATITAEASVR